MKIITKDALIEYIAAGVATATTAITATVDLGKSPEFDSICFFTSITTPNAGNNITIGEGSLANGSDAVTVTASKVTPTGVGPAGVAIDVVKPNSRFITITITRAGATTVAGDIWAVLYNAHTGPINNNLGAAATPLALFSTTNVAV